MRLIRPLMASLALAMPGMARAQESGIALGSDAPGAVVETLDGKQIDIADYVKKGPTLLQFWATWCSNCKALEPRINAAIKKYEGKVRFVAVAVSVNQSVERAKRYQAQHKLPVVMLYDRSGDASEAYETPATSYIVVVNKAGKVVYTGAGADQDLDAAIRKAL